MSSDDGHRFKLENDEATHWAKVMGAEVTGVDLSKPLSATSADELAKAFLDTSVAVWRDQKSATSALS